TPASVLNLKLTCRNMMQVVQRYLRSAFNINRALAHFFDDVHGFRQLQHRSGLLISGSFALQFMGRLHYAESDLDLFLPMHCRLEVALWLQANGYSFCATEHQAVDLETVLHAADVEPHLANVPYSLPGIFAVLTFRKPTGGLARPMTVQLIIAWRTPMEIVLGFHSTCVLNVITYTTAYAMYPRATFEDMRNLVLLDTEAQQSALVKYASRGWATVRELHFPEFALDLPIRSM
ncbi:hypothetical protein BDW22DRAFT_1303432, partial [Trametopsis cervina]